MRLHVALAACAAFIVCAAPASARVSTGQPAAELPRDVGQLAHHAPWHTGGQGRRVGWTQGKVKSRPVGRVPVPQSKKILIR